MTTHDRHNPILDGALQAARRRLMVAHLVRLAPPLLCVTGVASALLLLADRLIPDTSFPLTLPVWPYVVLSLCGLPIAMLIVWFRRPDSFAVARTLDDATLALNRYASAIEVRRDDRLLESHGPMAALLLADAASNAGRIDTKSALPVRMSSLWATVAVVLLAGVPVAWAYVPAADIVAAARRIAGIKNTEAENERQLEEAEQAIRSTLADARKQLEDSLANPDTTADDGDAVLIDDAAAQAVQTLDRLEEQLAAQDRSSQQAASRSNEAAGGGGALPEPSPSSDEMLAQAAEELDQVAQSLDEEAQQLDQAADEMRSRMSQAARTMPRSTESQELEPNDLTENDTPAPEFEEALSDGRIEDAARQLDDLAREVREMTPEQRQQLARRFERMADNLRPKKQPTPQSQQPSDDSVPAGGSDTQDKQETGDPDAVDEQPSEDSAQRDLMRDLGVSDESKLDQLEEDGWKRDDVEQALEDAGADDGSADRAADEIDRLNQEDRVRRQADEQTERLAERLREAARAVESEQPATPPNESQSQDDAGTQPPQDGTSREQEAQGTDGGDESGQQPPATMDEPGQPDTQTPPSQQDSETETEQVPSDAAAPPESDQQQQPPQGTDGQPAEAEPGSDEQQPQPSETPSQTDKEPGQGPVPADPPTGEGLDVEGTEPTDEQSSSSENVQPPDSGPALTDEPPGDTGSEPAPDAEGQIRRLREELERIGKWQDQAGKRREVSKEMQDKARELLEQLSPEEREELERWARDLAREQGQEPGLPGQDAGSDVGPPSGLQQGGTPDRDYDVVDLDARPEPGDGQGTGDPEPRDELTLSRWYRDPSDVPTDEDGQAIQGDTSGGGPEGGAQMNQLLKEAADAIERAVNQEAVAPKYRDFLRKWAKRVREHNTETTDE
ncbi:MAG: hypothetical protein D8M59_01085 [Planctomycetes bacterium]|nr:hypothetical protein [Planctomycetota bacterium]NOG54684.1 hypothetical protein [Planctomycetota bacterium]